MAIQHLLSTVRRLWAPAAIVVLLVCRGWSAAPEPKKTPANTTAASLVRAALEKELAGDNKGRDALLHEALDESPNNAAANWQLGKVQLQGKWRSTADVERESRLDERLAQYRRLRDAAQPIVADQAALALVPEESPGRRAATALAVRLAVPAKRRRGDCGDEAAAAPSGAGEARAGPASPRDAPRDRQGRRPLAAAGGPVAECGATRRRRLVAGLAGKAREDFRRDRHARPGAGAVAAGRVKAPAEGVSFHAVGADAGAGGESASPGGRIPHPLRGLCVLRRRPLGRRRRTEAAPAGPLRAAVAFRPANAGRGRGAIHVGRQRRPDLALFGVPGRRPGQSLAWADAFPADFRRRVDSAIQPAPSVGVGVGGAGDGNSGFRQPRTRAV